MTPSPMVTGSISLSTRTTPGSRRLKCTFRRKSIRPKHRHDHRELDDRAEQHADRVGVDLVVALEELAQPDQRADDHEIPDERRDRRDREVVVGVEDPHEQPVQAEQDDDREQHLREPDRQVDELGREAVARDEQRYHEAGGRR